MLRSENKIRSTHGGSLPPVVPAASPAEASSQTLTERVAEVIKKQVANGIDSVGNGEFWTGRGFAYYGQKIGGITTRDLASGERATGREEVRERDEFPALYNEMDRLGTLFCTPGEVPRYPASKRMVVTGPLKGSVTDALLHEIEIFKNALNASTPDEAFICVPGPSWLSNQVFNEYYRNEEEYFFALGEALRPEYLAVVRSGFVLQIDDPGLVTGWDMTKPGLTVDQYRRSLRHRVDALNHSLKDIPEDRVRLHVCWGSWHGPHTHDLPLEHVIDLLLQINVQAFSIEAGNVRHQHEWAVWKEATVPDGKILIPGVVSHATNIVEHPALIAQRILTFADIVGRENVIAGTDCGLGRRVHSDIVWAKLNAMSSGAILASKTLWPK